MDEGRTQIFTDKAKVGGLPDTVLVSAAEQQTELQTLLVAAAGAEPRNPGFNSKPFFLGLTSRHLV